MSDLRASVQRMALTDPQLLHDLRPHIKGDKINLANAPQTLIDRLSHWLQVDAYERGERRVPPPRPPQTAEPKPVAPPAPPKEPQLIDTHHADMRKLVDSENARIRGERRLQHWLTQGLLDNQHNANAITNFIETSDKLKALKGKITAQTVDLAVDFLGPKGSNVLQWRKPQQQVAPVVKAVPVELLLDGSPRLPLGTVPSRKHTLEQLRNLDQRERAAKHRERPKSSVAVL